MKIFVHLARSQDASDWQRKWRKGELIGLNEELPYGYHHAAEFGCDVSFSHAPVHGAVRRVARLALRGILGFDLLHAWENRKEIASADVVWTHTESQGLAVALILLLISRERAPRLILQSVWLADRWARYGIVRRGFLKFLLRRADILTFLSAMNRDAMRLLLPDVRCEFIKFGIRTDLLVAPRQRSAPLRLRLLSLGNDEHRDWKTLVRAVSRIPTAELRIASGNVPHRLVRGVAKVTITRPRNNQELLELFDWADIVVVPLKNNLHCSGITVIQETVCMGIPVIASDTGGLGDYFPSSDITYVPPADETALKRAIADLAANPDQGERMVASAQSRIGLSGLSSVSYVRRHVELSRDLLAASGRRAIRDEVARQQS